MTLTLLKKNVEKRANGQWYSLYRCHCGKEHMAYCGNVNNGHIKTCGCSRVQNARDMALNRRLPKGQAQANHVLAVYKKSAKKRKIHWDLADQDFSRLTQQPCYYCGSEPSNVSRAAESHGVHTYNGLDRVDNRLGYHISNVVPCCKICNTMKFDSSQHEFLFHIWMIMDHMKEKEQAQLRQAFHDIQADKKKKA